MDFILRIDTSVILWSQKNITTLANIYAHEDANFQSLGWFVLTDRLQRYGTIPPLLLSRKVLTESSRNGLIFGCVLLR